MRIDDINKFKGQLKSVLQQWGNGKIDKLFGNKPQMAVFVKNGLNNIMARMDAKLNKYIDGLVLFVGDENGVVDTDTMVDMAAEMFKGMEVQKYEFEMADIFVGNGKVVLHFPNNFIIDMLFGSSGNITLTTEDLLEMKEMFNGFNTYRNEQSYERNV